MSGCRTGTGGYPGGSVTDPIEGPASGLFRVYRGGSWFNRQRQGLPGVASRLLPAWRQLQHPSCVPATYDLGFRLLRME